MLVGKFDAEHGSSEDGCDFSFGFDDFFSSHRL